jgi:adenylate kinase
LNIVLFGPPGAGKGTQSALLVERLGMFHISTGDLFREAMKNNTKLGLQAKEFVNSGQLVPDSVVIGMVEEAVKALGKRAFILDGFPRTKPQAEALNRLLSAHSLKIDRAVFLEVPQVDLMTRLSGRRVCVGCGAVYHVSTKAPKTEAVCDVCGKEVVQRKDDQEEVIGTRLKAYSDSTKPLKEYFGEIGLLSEVSGVGSSEVVFARLQKVVVN